MKQVNIEREITLALTKDGAVAPICIITYELKEENESDFFSSIDDKKELRYSVISKEDVILEEVDAELIDNAVKKYPEELEQVIRKGINNISSLANKRKRKYLHFEDKESKELLDKATKEWEDGIKKLKSTSGGANLDEMLDRYWFKKHILIRGAKGVGKTYTVDKRLNDENIDFEIVMGHEGMESIDLLGYYIRNEKGNTVWLDGSLSKAFRKAQSDKCCLFFDEILRMPSRELNILVGALTPSSKGTYRLRTNRVVNEEHGVGETELLEVSVDNLWCVATTNIGAGYQVDDIDDALSDRFRICDKTSSSDEVKSILTSVSSGKISESMINCLIDFYQQTNDLVHSGELEKEVNLRHLSEVVTFAKDDSEVKFYMSDLLPTWCSTDTNGSLNKAEKEIINKLIKKLIKG